MGWLTFVVAKTDISAGGVRMPDRFAGSTVTGTSAVPVTPVTPKSGASRALAYTVVPVSSVFMKFGFMPPVLDHRAASICASHDWSTAVGRGGVQMALRPSPVGVRGVAE